MSLRARERQFSDRSLVERAIETSGKQREWSQNIRLKTVNWRDKSDQVAKHFSNAKRALQTASPASVSVSALNPISSLKRKVFETLID